MFQLDVGVRVDSPLKIYSIGTSYYLINNNVNKKWSVVIDIDDNVGLVCVNKSIEFFIFNVSTKKTCKLDIFYLGAILIFKDYGELQFLVEGRFLNSEIICKMSRVIICFSTLK